MPQPYDEWPDEISWGDSDESSPSGPDDDAADRRRVALRRGLLALVLAGTAVIALDQGGLLSADGPAGDRAGGIGQETPTPVAGDDPAAPTQTPAPNPPAVAALPRGLRLLDPDRPPEVPYAVDNVVHGTAEQFTFPEDWEIHQLETVVDGLLVSAATPEGPLVSVFGRTPGSAAPSQVVIARGRDAHLVRVAVDPTGTEVAWTRSQGTRRHWLSVTRVGEPDPYARIRLDAPAQPHAWVAGVGPMLSYALDPGGAPFVYDLARDRLLPVVDRSAYRRTFEPTFLAYSSATDRLLLSEFERCELARDLPVESVRCVPSRWQAAAFSGARPADLVAMLSGRRLLVLDSEGVIRMERFLPDGLMVQDVTWEDEGTVLVLGASDTGSLHVLRCPVGRSCSRAYDGGPDETVVLSHSP